MIHVCRDFLSIGNPINLNCTRLVPYYLAIFMRTCLGYTIVGQTNFNLAGGTLRLGGGAAGSLNQGTGNELAFSPNGYAVSAADLGRILAIKSSNNSMISSGLFRVTGVDTGNNWLFINYRSGDTPPVETGMTWALYASETVFNSSINLTGNGTTGTYQGQGAATQSRIVMQSPSALAWQARIAFENFYDSYFGGGSVGPTDGTTTTTVTPGYGGTAAGDFLPGGQHLHSALFFNNHDVTFTGAYTSWWPASTNQVRIYIWGDDVTGTVFAAARNVLNGTDSFLHFGLPENEEQPLPPKAVQRLFAIGAGNGANSPNSIVWTTGAGVGGSAAPRAGMAFGLCNQPVSCTYSLYTSLVTNGFSFTAARSTVAAGDNSYIAATELLPADLLAGTIMNYTSQVLQNTSTLQLEGRRLGQAPLVRMGRSNYGYFQIATAGSQLWLHLNDGMYMPWQGSILP